MNLQKFSKKGLFTATAVISMFIGAAGATIFNAVQVSAQSVTPQLQTVTQNALPTQSVTMPAMDTGMFKSNEDPAHEAGESPQREAQENAGQRPTVK